MRSGGRNFPAIEFAGKKSLDLAFSNVDRYERSSYRNQATAVPAAFGRRDTVQI